MAVYEDVLQENFNSAKGYIPRSVLKKYNEFWTGFYLIIFFIKFHFLNKFSLFNLKKKTLKITVKNCAKWIPA
jgi:hypothetical protein